MDGLPLDIAAGAREIETGTKLGRAEAAQRAAAGGDRDKAAKMFEELLGTVLVREMRRGLEDGFFGKGPGADVFEGWLDEHVGHALSATGALDLAQAIRVSLGAKEKAAADAELDR